MKCLVRAFAEWCPCPNVTTLISCETRKDYWAVFERENWLQRNSGSRGSAGCPILALEKVNASLYWIM